MEVEYELTPEDLKAFQRYHAKHPLVPPKKGLQSLVAGLAFGGAVIVGVFGYNFLRTLVYSSPYTSYTPVLYYLLELVPGVLMGAVLGLLGLSLYLRLVLGNVTRKALQEGRNAEKVLGWRRMVLDANAIHTTSAFSSSRSFWEGVDAVVATDDYAFLYLTTRVAHVVPRRAFADDRAFDEFVKAARRFRQLGGVAPEAPGGAWERPRPGGVLPPAKSGDAEGGEGIVRGGGGKA